jgi:hypothetical protein
MAYKLICIFAVRLSVARIAHIIKVFKGIDFLLYFSLLLFLTLASSLGVANDIPEVQNQILEKCELEITNNDIEKRYQNIQKKLEEDYNLGIPKQLKDNLINMRKQIDQLMLESFDLQANNSQEINSITHKIISKLEEMISILPKASQWAPKIRSQYVIPFTNINSIKAEHQDCLMRLAVKDIIDTDVNVKENETSENIYQKLTSELNQLNNNLYSLETTDIEKYIGLRNQLLIDLESYNKTSTPNQLVSKNIPSVLNSIQAEIERLLPSLELSKTYLSLVD